MIHFDLPKQKSSIIKVLGVGGGGSNAVNFMFEQDIHGVDFIICNTDAKAFEQSKVPNKIQLGPHLTQGLGAGADPNIGMKATQESLEEIKKILEVNTKMAFITAGMGGGTGTGGAPVIAQVCKELGILTVGIVTTPFGFEGPRRMQQAQQGIDQLKPHVDTLLVISNDKLRMQYGNLKMREAFGKADNVLATAAKCITDIINSKGHIIVDFADVCTVMKNGGVAILGSSSVEGENRAQLAIEEALASPLLNDSDIRGAKWVLVNINSAEGEFECTMDEMETISSYLRMQAGEHTDVIIGMGYDQSLGEKIGITLIATGFDASDPFSKKPEVIKQAVPEKEVVTLDLGQTTAPVQQTAPVVESQEPTWMPHLTGQSYTTHEQVLHIMPEVSPSAVQEISADEYENTVLHFELTPEVTNEVISDQSEKKLDAAASIDPLLQFDVVEKPSLMQRPTQVYASETNESGPLSQSLQQTNLFQNNSSVENDFQLIEKDEVSTPSIQTPENKAPLAVREEEMDPEELKRKQAERIQKLRNLTYNFNSDDSNNEFEDVPAYVRRNMELFGNAALASVENFYSNSNVKKDEKDQIQISTLNSFLEGKKPD